MPRRGCPEGRLRVIAESQSEKEVVEEKGTKKDEEAETGWRDDDPLEKRFRVSAGHPWVAKASAATTVKR